MTYTRFTVPTRSENIKKPSYTKNNGSLKSSSTLYGVKYPEHTHIVSEPQKKTEAAEQGSALDYVFSAKEDFAYAPPPRQSRIRSKFLSAACVALSVLLGSLLIYISGIEAPDYLQNAFMSSYDLLSERYEQAFYNITEKNATSDDLPLAQSHFTPQAENIAEDKKDGYDITEGSFIASAVVAESEKSDSESNREDASFVASYEDSEATGADDAVIVSKNLSRGSDKVYALNETSLSLDTDALATAAYPIAAYSTGSDDPLVLIVHTHGTECYSDSTVDGSVRTTDKSKNVVRVGKELADILNSYGIHTVHSETMHDEISYITSYQSSRKEITEMLELYPTVKYVIDLHRDAIPNDGESRVKPCAEINGETSAQIMLVMGTSAGGGNHPNYSDNLTVASHLQKRLNDVYPGLARPINVRSAIFNQNLSTGSLLLEVGSDANTLDEALTAVRLFARCFAETIIKGR